MPAISPRVAVGAVALDRTGRVLLVRRAQPPLAGEWTLPGGKVEAGESLEQAVVRELAEETALATRVVASLGVVTLAREGFFYAIHEFLVIPLDGATPRPGDDAAEVRWATRAELEGLGVSPDAVALVDAGIALDAKRRSGS